MYCLFIFCRDCHFARVALHAQDTSHIAHIVALALRHHFKLNLLIAPQHKLFVAATDKKYIMQPLPAPGVAPMLDRYIRGYEGYGIGGAAVMVDCLTDNKTRTVAEVRHAFSKHGGNMGTDGCVAFQFKHCGQMIFAPGTDEGALMDAAIEAGADDVNTNDDGSIEVITAPTEFIAVKDALEAAGFKPEFAEVTMKPEGENVFAGDDGLKMQKLLDALESLDDVQEIYTTAVIED